MRFVRFGRIGSKNDSDTDGQYDLEVDTVDGEKTKSKCKHRSIANYACTQPGCNFKMTKFGTFFDSGFIPRYMRILTHSDSEDCCTQLQRDLDVIYLAYAPTNII